MIDTSWINSTSNLFTGALSWLTNFIVWLIGQIGFIEVCIIAAIIAIVYVWSKTTKPRPKSKIYW